VALPSRHRILICGLDRRLLISSFRVAQSTGQATPTPVAAETLLRAVTEYGKKDAARDTGASPKTVSHAWHEARDESGARWWGELDRVIEEESERQRASLIAEVARVRAETHAEVDRCVQESPDGRVDYLGEAMTPEQAHRTVDARSDLALEQGLRAIADQMRSSKAMVRGDRRLD
jgi:hypothetical protein